MFIPYEQDNHCNLYYSNPGVFKMGSGKPQRGRNKGMLWGPWKSLKENSVKITKYIK